MRRADLFAAVATFVLVLVVVGSVRGAGEIPLFRPPVGVTDNLGETTKMINETQDKMAEQVYEVDTLMSTYTDTCKGDSTDAGCVEMMNQIKQKFLGVLKTMEGELPKIRSTISQTAQKLGSALKKHTQNKSVKDLYKSVSEKSAIPTGKGALSKKLTQMLNLMRRTSKGGVSDISALEMNLQIQSDLIASEQVLSLLEAEISHQRMFVETAVNFADLSPAIGSVMDGMSEIFDYEGLGEQEPVTTDEPGVSPGEAWFAD